MLVLTRKAGQSIELDLDMNLDTPVREALAAGSIEVHVVQVEGSNVKLGIKAKPRLEKGRDGPAK
jgi:sRNA-binding carbon storage regulator CsrA